MIEFKLPFLGADVDQGKLLQWSIKPGDAVHRGQVVAVVDTSKAAVDVESWQEGTVYELLVQPGETVPVGAVLATLLEPGESAPSAPAPRREQAPQPAPAEAVALGAPAAAAPVPVAAAASFTTPLTTPPAAPSDMPLRRRISPAARKHAEDAGIDIGMVAGTGPDGAVTLQDVQQAIDAGAAPAVAHVASIGPAVSVAPAAPAPSQPAAADRMAEMRKSIAAAMSRSKREIPHYYLSETVPMQQAQRWLLEANRDRPLTERLLLAVLQIKAVALAAAQYGTVNGFFVDGAHRPAAAVHVGVAISLRQGGLIAPALHDVAAKPLAVLMRELSDLVRRARAGSLRSSEMSDPTITVTNLGDQGVEAVHGVIYPPQVALVGFGRVTERPWAADGGLFVLPVVTATLAADHRVSDGHTGALFLAAVRERLQHPEQL